MNGLEKGYSLFINVYLFETACFSSLLTYFRGNFLLDGIFYFFMLDRIWTVTASFFFDGGVCFCRVSEVFEAAYPCRMTFSVFPYTI